MIDNALDKGYLAIQVKEEQDGFHLLETTFSNDPDIINLYIDYEDGCIFIDWGDGSPRKILGYYESTADSVYLAKVYDRDKTRVIGRVGQELIYFRRKEADPSVGRYSPEEECLAYYTKNGNITALKILPYFGSFFGSEIGGAAAFVAVFTSYNFKSVFFDYLHMEKEQFEQKHAQYMNPLGL